MLTICKVTGEFIELNKMFKKLISLLKRKKVQKTLDFFEPENLAGITINYDGKVFNYDEIALLVIDVQEEFCDPKHREKRGTKHTVEVSERIQSIVPKFRKANIPVYAIYYSENKIKDLSKIDFFKFTPASNDTLIRKTADSAFRGSNIKNILQEDKKKLLLTCGFNLNACVKRTVTDAKEHGFEVCLLDDLTGNDENHPKCFDFAKREQIRVETSDKILEIITQAKAQKPQPKL